jgi:flagellar hook-associated protein 1 FlgK
MSSLSAIFASGNSGLQAAQTGLRAVSDNISNIDTKGYVRKLVDQAPLVSGGVTSGVQVTAIRLATDRFLQAAGLSANGSAGAAGVSAALWDQAQSLFGDPSGDTSFFSSLDKALNAFSTVAGAPTSTAARAAAVDQLDAFFNNAESISSQIDNLKAQADARIKSNVIQINSLLAQIDKLNAEVSRDSVIGGDPTGAQTRQSQLVDELSSLLGIRVSNRSNGGVNVSTVDGVVLVGDGHASLAYDASGPTGDMFLTNPAGNSLGFGQPSGGEIAGLLNMRNNELPALKASLAELVSGAADQLNAIHNAYSAFPPPSKLEGRQTGLAATEAAAGFTGKTTVDVMDGSGTVTRRVTIDFDAGTLNDGATTTAFTPATFFNTLNTALTPAATANFTNGVLTLQAAGAGGVAVADDAATPASKAGRGFSAYFGLNDLVRSSGAYDYNTGLAAASPNGFIPGGTTTFRMTGPDGSRVADITVTMPAGDMTALLGALNSTATGLGVYGSFSLDANGQVSFAPTSGYKLSVVQDNTARTVGGASMTEFFGIGEAARAGRAGGFEVRPDIVTAPANLSLAKLDDTATVGARALASGDTRGADALSRAGMATLNFDAAGKLGATRQSLGDYAAALSGSIARTAAAADSAQTNAEAIAAEAAARRSGVEGVNLDQELISLTTYQQAYNASARLIQAAKDMFDVLLNMTN